MGNGEFDPVQFGKLIATVEGTSKKMDETMETMNKFITATRTTIDSLGTRITDVEKDSMLKKGAVVGALGGGAVAGVSLTEIGKKILEKLLT